MQKNLLTVGVPGFAEFSALAGGDGLAASAKNSPIDGWGSGLCRV